MTGKKGKATAFALLAAALYAISTPFSKLLLNEVSAVMMAALLYLGAGIGLMMMGPVQRAAGKGDKEKPLTAKELPYTAAMVVLDVLAPVFLMLGLKSAPAANVSLLNNFEIVTTALIALVLFREAVSKRLWLAIGLVTLAGMILSFEGEGSLSFSYGSLFVLLACVCWGFENNCTRKLSAKNPRQIVIIKGLGSGLISLAAAFILGEKVPEALPLVCTLLLGFVAYGLSIYFYIYAQRDLGAARTSTYYAAAPFIGSAISLVIFRTVPSLAYLIALAIMLAGTYLSASDTKA